MHTVDLIPDAESVALYDNDDTIAPLGPVAVLETLLHEMLGLTVSVDVTLKLHVELRPALSTAVHLTVVTPSENEVPEAGEQ